MSTFNVFYQTIDSTVLKCARVQLVEDQLGRLEKVYFNYHPDFLGANQHCVDPNLLPLSNALVELNCDKEAPGFIDDLLPDDWGKKVLARLHQIPRPTLSQLLSFMDYSSVGALHFCTVDSTAAPQFGLGCEKNEIVDLQDIADRIELGAASPQEIERIKLKPYESKMTPMMKCLLLQTKLVTPSSNILNGSRWHKVTGSQQSKLD